MPIVTPAIVLHVAAGSERLPRSCVDLTPLRRGRVTAVLRAGPLIRSVTLRADGDRRIYGCDETGVRFEGRRWCAIAAGTLRGGTVTDPRLELLCRDRRRRRVATAWINPRGRTRRIVVDGVAYPTAAGLPIRVATVRRIDYRRARATFFVHAYDDRGRLIGRRRVTAHVSG